MKGPGQLGETRLKGRLHLLAPLQYYSRRSEPADVGDQLAIESLADQSEPKATYGKDFAT